MYCKNCGKQLDSDALFCNECGTSLVDEETTTDNVEPSSLENIDVAEINNEEVKEDNMDTLKDIENEETLESTQDSENILHDSDEETAKVVPLIENSKQDESFKETKKSKLWLIITLIVVLVVGGLLGFYFFVLKAPKNIFNKAIDKAYTNLVSNTKNNVKTSKGSLNFGLNIKSDLLDEDIKNLINNLDLKLDYAIDTEKKYAELYFDSSYKKKELLNLGLIFNKNYGYIDLKDLYSKYIRKEKDTQSSEFKNLTFDDYEYISRTIKESLKSSIDVKSYKTSAAKVIINDKEENTTKNTLSLSNVELSKVVKKIQDKLVNDKKFIKTLSTILNETEENTKKIIKTDVSLDEEFTLNIDIYTKGLFNECVKVGASIFNEENKIDILFSKDDDKYTYELNSGLLAIKGSYEEKTNGDIKTYKYFIECLGNSIELSMDVNEKTDVTIESKKIDDYIDFDDVDKDVYTEIEANIQKNDTIKELVEKFDNKGITNFDFENSENDDTDENINLDDDIVIATSIED